MKGFVLSLALMVLYSSARAAEYRVDMHIPYTSGDMLNTSVTYEVGDKIRHEDDDFDWMLKSTHFEVEIWVERAGGSPIDWNVEEWAYITVPNVGEGEVVPYTSQTLSLNAGDRVAAYVRINGIGQPNGGTGWWYLKQPGPYCIGGWRRMETPKVWSDYVEVQPSEVGSVVYSDCYLTGLRCMNWSD